MIKKTLCFTNPAYLSIRDKQLVIKLPEIENDKYSTLGYAEKLDFHQSRSAYSLLPDDEIDDIKPN